MCKVTPRNDGYCSRVVQSHGDALAVRGETHAKWKLPALDLAFGDALSVAIVEPHEAVIAAGHETAVASKIQSVCAQRTIQVAGELAPEVVRVEDAHAASLAEHCGDTPSVSGKSQVIGDGAISAAASDQLSAGAIEEVDRKTLRAFYAGEPAYGNTAAIRRHRHGEELALIASPDRWPQDVLKSAGAEIPDARGLISGRGDHPALRAIHS